MADLKQDPVAQAETGSALENAKQELLESLRKKNLSARGPADPSPLAHAARTGLFPLSHAQRRLWFLDHMQPGNPAYHVPVAMRITGDLRVDHLQRSLQEVARRHDMLTVTLVMQGAEAVQCLGGSEPPALELTDLSELPADQREAALQESIQAESLRPFNLMQERLWRVALYRLDRFDHVLMVTLHHIIADGWSVGIFVRDLATAYERLSAGVQGALPVPPAGYVDFAAWQREQLTGQALDERLAFWRTKLAGAPEVLELPTDHPRPHVHTYAGAAQSFKLPRLLVRSLEELARAEGATLFMVLLAAFKLLLHRYTRQEDIVVGTPTAGRNQARWEDTVGCFVNTLALRTDLSGTPTFRELLGRVRETLLTAYRYDDLPFEQLVDALGVGRDLGRNPLFQVMFAYNNTPLPEERFAGLTLKPLTVPGATAKFDLTLELWNESDELVGRLEYATDLFAAETIQRVMEHYVTLLTALVQTPEQSIASLPILPASERQQLLEWRGGGADFPVHACLHERFADQVDRSPDAIAVSYAGEQLSYGELDRRANRLAHYLQKLGAGPERLVGLYTERSLDMVVAVLAILKAGAAYLPIDPGYPQDRIAFMLQDGGADLVVTQQSLLPNLPEGVHAVCLDRDEPQIARGSDQRPVSQVRPDHLAYVIYTSGSTGRPKGVQVEHQQVMRLFDATQQWYGFDQRDVWTLFHSIAFDFSVWELWGALLYGGRLVVVPYLVSRAPEDFLALLAQEQVTVLNQTPSAFRQLIGACKAAVGPVPPLALRFVIFGGEALELQSLKPWFTMYGDQQPQLVNMYGITETTVHVSYRPIRVADVAANAGSVIGQPIPDLEIYLLDENQQPVPVGVPGEIYVGGAGVARGYLNRPELTAQRFVSPPFSAAGGARLYRSGDLARYRPNGDLEYLGRIDHQVKLRGFRIELGEIESAIMTHPDIAETVVLLREDTRGDKRLVAYVAGAHNAALRTGELRSHLQPRLPEYMIPTAFVVLPALPLNSNGKVDRRALPVPEPGDPRSTDSYVAPRTVAEEVLAEIWGQVLGLDRVGICDNFFALGGDSIRSIQVLSLARERGLSLTLADLFQCQTIAELAQRLQTSASPSERLLHTEPFVGVSPADRARMQPGVEDAYPMTRLQLGMLYHLQFAAESHTYHNITSFYMRMPVHPHAMQQAVAELVARHPILRTGFDLTSYTEPLQVVFRDVAVQVGVTDWRHLSAEEQEMQLGRWLEQEKQHGFDLLRPPLLRFHLHWRSDTTVQLTITECHAILDGWSLTSLIAEAFDLYFAFVAGSSLPTSPGVDLTYRDFVMLERRVLESEEHQQFWLDRLAGSEPTMLPRWPGYSGTGPQQVYRQIIPVDNPVRDSLVGLAREVSVPLKSVLLAAHFKVLSLASGKSDLMTGFACNGRPEEGGGDRLRGLFINTVPLRLQLGSGSWRDLVKQTFQAEWSVLPYRRYPLAALQERWGRQALFETMFNFVHFHALREMLGQQVEILDFFESADTNVPLLVNFSIVPHTGRLQLLLDIDTRQIAPEQAERIGQYYRAVLTEMAHQPAASHNATCLLTEQERWLSLEQWSTVRTNYPRNHCIHELFADQVRRTPDAVALVDGDQQVTYQELNHQANRLARHLRTLGVGPDLLVGIYLERSVATIVTMLGILKAGGAYLPLDVSYPPDRLAFMLRDAQAPVLVTTRTLAPRFVDQEALHLVCLDDLAAEQGLADDDLPPTSVTPDNLAYVIYTSGSTGVPKGVAVGHRAVVRTVVGTNYVDLGPADCVAQASNTSFDAATFEVWGALLNGARLVIVDRETVLSPGALTETIRHQGINTMFLTSSLFNQVAAVAPDAFAGMRYLLVGGEALDPRWVRAVLRQGVAGVYNGYGPTENTTFSTVHRVETVPETARSIPIGRPLANSQAYVLDEHMQPVALGAPGELYVGGDGLARGYLNRPAITAERFLPHPFSSEAGARLYRTGDLVRYLPDGSIDYLSRLDNQIKLRGFRIELGEIEAVLAKYPGMQAFAVIVREDTPGDRRLVAYVSADQGQLLDVQALRSFLRERLPDYMVPAAIVPVSVLPLTPNGKLDRQALPVPDREQFAAAENYVAPRDSVQEILSLIWAEVLGMERVSVRADFFDLGGQSLLALQIISRVEQTLRVPVPIRLLFEGPTIEQMAEALRATAERPALLEQTADLVLKLATLSDSEVEELLQRHMAEI